MENCYLRCLFCSSSSVVFSYALKYDNLQGTSYELVRRGLTISNSFVSDGTWFHINFKANQVMDGKYSHSGFFAEIQADVSTDNNPMTQPSTVTACIIMGGIEGFGTCSFCPNVVHPQRGFLKQWPPELELTSPSYSPARMCELGIVARPKFSPTHKEDKPKFSPYYRPPSTNYFNSPSSYNQPATLASLLLDPHIDAMPKSSPYYTSPYYYNQPATTPASRALLSLASPRDAMSRGKCPEWSDEHLRRVKAALEYFNEKYGTVYEPILDGFTCFESDGTWFHCNFTAKQAVDGKYSHTNFFAEIRADDSTDSPMTVNTCLILEGGLNFDCSSPPKVVRPGERFLKSGYKYEPLCLPEGGFCC